MAVSTNVPGLVFTAEGWQAPSEQAILTGVQADINAAFGGNVNPALTTPQGQLASSITAIIAEVNAQTILLFNMFDPAFAYGRAQDAIGRLYFLARQPALPTTVDCTCTGGEGTIIPAGSVAKAADGLLYRSTDAGTIGAGGTVTISFACDTYGPIACPAGTLTTIFRAIPGWDAITNPADGVLGRATESRAQFEERRAASVAKNAVGSLNAVQGAVLDVTDVLDAYVTENTTSSPITVRGVSVAAKSLYVAASGGTDADVAQAIWSKKAPGCGYNGTTTVTVEDTAGVYSAPLPSYAVSFVRPTSLAILFSVVLQNNAQIPVDAASQIQAAIMLAFAGADGGSRARIGSNILASRYYAAVSALGSWAQVLTITLGSNNAPGATFTGSIAGTALTTSAPTGVIAIGQTISDVAGAIPAGTIITAGSGSSWTINKSLTVPSRTMKGVTPTLTTVSVNADQVPTINADNIAVTTT
jgi:uncharacterized phage protein gp47/JayE